MKQTTAAAATSRIILMSVFCFLLDSTEWNFRPQQTTKFTRRTIFSIQTDNEDCKIVDFIMKRTGICPLNKSEEKTLTRIRFAEQTCGL